MPPLNWQTVGKWKNMQKPVRVGDYMEIPKTIAINRVFPFVFWIIGYKKFFNFVCWKKKYVVWLGNCSPISSECNTSLLIEETTIE